MASVSAAAGSEDRLVLLRALRDRLALELDTAKAARDVEPLARRLQSVAAEIEALAALKESDTVVDVLRQRVEARRRQAVERRHG